MTAADSPIIARRRTIVEAAIDTMAPGSTWESIDLHMTGLVVYETPAGHRAVCSTSSRHIPELLSSPRPSLDDGSPIVAVVNVGTGEWYVPAMAPVLCSWKHCAQPAKLFGRSAFGGRLCAEHTDISRELDAEAVG